MSNESTHASTEGALRTVLSTVILSPSHDRWHLDHVLGYARELQRYHGGDPDVLTAAVLLHDLGRSDPSKHGQASADASMDQAREILNKIQFPIHKVEQVLLAIKEHDKPEVTPSTVEGRILKDADFLAGFGAWGVLRIAMWAVESRQVDERVDVVDQIMHRLLERMPRRLDKLEFVESRELAYKQTLFTNLFLKNLRQEPLLETNHQKGRYVVVEGISGSGKDTQAERLKARLEQDGYQVVLVYEPTDCFREYRRIAETSHDDASEQTPSVIDLIEPVTKLEAESPSHDPGTTMFLLLADRYQLIRSQVLPALEQGKVVISVRSYISTMVYQRSSVYSPTEIAFLHSFVPLPDVVILYDLEPSVAYTRICARAEKEKRRLSERENMEDLPTLRERYLKVCDDLPGVKINVQSAEGTVEEIARDTWRNVSELLRLGQISSL